MCRYYNDIIRGTEVYTTCSCSWQCSFQLHIIFLSTMHTFLNLPDGRSAIKHGAVMVKRPLQIRYQDPFPGPDACPVYSTVEYDPRQLWVISLLLGVCRLSFHDLLPQLVKVQNWCAGVKVQVMQKKATQVEVKVHTQKNCTWSTSKK